MFQVYRKAKVFFHQPTISVFGGLSLVKSERTGKSLDEPTIKIESANTVENRENELESYVINRAKNFFEERSLHLDFASTARTLANAIPDDIKESVRSFVVARATKKKEKIRAIKNFLRLVFLFKLKIFAVIAIIAILIAKKALLLAVIAIAVSGASIAQSLFSKLRGGLGGGPGGFGGNNGGHGGGHEEIIAYTNGASGNAGWSSAGANSGGWSGRYDTGYGEHGSHSSPVAQSLAYSGHQTLGNLLDVRKPPNQYS